MGELPDEVALVNILTALMQRVHRHHREFQKNRAWSFENGRGAANGSDEGKPNS